MPALSHKHTCSSLSLDRDTRTERCQCGAYRVCRYERNPAYYEEKRVSKQGQVISEPPLIEHWTEWRSPEDAP